MAGQHKRALEGVEINAYVRVSGPLQKVGRQRGDLADDCDQFGFRVVREFTDDGISASLFAKQVRDDFELLCGLIRTGEVDGAVIWIHEVSRLTRNIEEFGALRKLCREHRVRWFVWSYRRIMDLNNDDDRMALTKAATEAEEEVTRLRMRVHSGMRQQRRTGRPHGRIPFGYERIYDPMSGEFLEQRMHPEMGPLVREAASRFASGESARSIARDFNARGILAPAESYRRQLGRVGNDSNNWQPGHIARMVANPVYVGRRKHTARHDDGTRTTEFFDGDWEPILDLETHLACVNRTRENAAGQVPRDSEHLLTGVAVCGVCQGYVSARRFRQTKREGFQYFCTANGCAVVDEPYVDQRALAVIAEILNAQSWRQATAFNAVAVEQAQTELSALEQEYADALGMAETGELSTRGLASLEKRIVPQIERARAALDELMRPSVQQELSAYDGDDGFARFCAMPRDRQRAWAKRLVQVAIYPRGRGGRFDHIPDRCVTVVPIE